MRPELIGLLVGGVLPPVFYALTGVFTKSSTDHGIDVSSYLIIVGCSIIAVGVGSMMYFDERILSMKSGAYAFGTGAAWAIGMALFSFALIRFQEPVSKLVPLHGIAPLLTVLLAFLLFAEWREVAVMKLLLGSVLIVAGGILVARA